MAGAQGRRLVLIDQDGSGPGGSNQMAMLALLQSPEVEVLGITMVTGNAWRDEETAHTLRMLELTGHTDVPVARGAVFPLVRSEQETRIEELLYGRGTWLGAWGHRVSGSDALVGRHEPIDVPALAEGMPATKAIDEDAAHFLVRQVRTHPHQVTIYAAGPMTNIALAISIDPEFAGLTQGIVLMGGSLNPQTADPEFSASPRHEFNFWFDPEAAHIVLRAAWPRVDVTTVDISLKAMFTAPMLEETARSGSKTAKYVAAWSQERWYLWDELAACAWLDPKIVTGERLLYMDVDLNHGPTYGDTLTWTENQKPATGVRLVHAQTELDLPRFEREFVGLMGR